MPISSRFVINFTFAALAIGFLSLIAIIGTTIWLGERARGYLDETVRLRDIRLAAIELRSALQNAESSQRGFLIGGNQIYLAPYDTAKDRAGRELDRLRELLGRSGQSAPMLARLSAMVSEKFQEMDRTIELKSDFRDAAALEAFRTNRGKALMDEAGLFLSSIVRMADIRMTESAAEQRENASRLRWVSTVGGLVIILVVAGVIVTVVRYSKEAAQGRREVQILNASLEQRVKDRTAELVRARDKAEVLLAEVNHRVANSLFMVASMVHMQSSASTDKAVKDALSEVESRIQAISSVHKRLYSSGDSQFVDLDEYLSTLLSNVEAAMQDEGHHAALRYELEPLKLKTDASVNLGVIVAEWVTNAYKYAYPDRRGEIRVRLKRLSDREAELLVEDDGVGRAREPTVKGTGLGTRIVTAMAHAIGARVEYLQRDPGTTARLAFTTQAI